MRYVKLQFGCLLVILYIMIAYLRAVKRKNQNMYGIQFVDDNGSFGCNF